jgi:hypothetical protein
MAVAAALGAAGIVNKAAADTAKVGTCLNQSAVVDKGMMAALGFEVVVASLLLTSLFVST